MRSWYMHIVGFLEREDGPTAVEYAVMLALVAVVCVSAITSLGAKSNRAFARANAALVAGS